MYLISFINLNKPIISFDDDLDGESYANSFDGQLPFCFVRLPECYEKFIQYACIINPLIIIV